MQLQRGKFFRERKYFIARTWGQKGQNRGCVFVSIIVWSHGVHAEDQQKQEKSKQRTKTGFRVWLNSKLIFSLFLNFFREQLNKLFWRRELSAHCREHCSACPCRRTSIPPSNSCFCCVKTVFVQGLKAGWCPHFGDNRATKEQNLVKYVCVCGHQGWRPVFVKNATDIRTQCFQDTLLGVCTFAFAVRRLYEQNLAYWSQFWMLAPWINTIARSLRSILIWLT